MQIQAPAKINLFLQVVGKREDGYHDLRTLMCCVGLYDTMVLRLGVRKHEITCDHAEVPCDASNLALKAALRFNQALAEETDTPPQYLSIRLTKRIPVGAGKCGQSIPQRSGPIPDLDADASRQSHKHYRNLRQAVRTYSKRNRGR